MDARLTLFASEGPAREVLLERACRYRLGRAPDCEIRIDDAELSRRHAVLEYDGRRWLITDTHSKNGMTVAGQPATAATLDGVAWVNLGTSIVRFESLDAAAIARWQDRSSRVEALTLDGRQRIDAATDVSAMLDGLLDTFLSISSTERGFALLSQPGGDFEVATSRGIADESQPMAYSFSRGAVRQALSTRQRVVVCDIAAQAALANRASVVASQVKALVCLPLRAADRIIGVVYADSRKPGHVFTELDVGMLEELAERAALAIAAGQLDAELEGIARSMPAAAAEGAAAQRPARGVTLRARPLSGVFWSRIDPDAADNGQ